MRWGFFIVCFLMTCSCASSGPVEYPPHRWLREKEGLLIEKPKTREAYVTWDIADMQVFYRLIQAVNIPDKTRNFLYKSGVGTRPEAINVSNFDEVINSRWFTNRLGRHSLSLQELSRGPNKVTGPGLHGPWTIHKAYTQGLMVGFEITDSHGDVFLIKFDPAGFPELATGAELISTKLFHAFGYNVPEAYLVYMNPKILQISPDATTTDLVGLRKKFGEDQLLEVLAQCEEDKRGRCRVLAVKQPPGEPIGPFPLSGRRRDDPQDRVDHQRRRELRGYQVFSALLDNRKAHEVNTLDMFIPVRRAKGIVKHYVFNFASSLGSNGAGPKTKTHLYDYRMNYARTLTSMGLISFYRPYTADATTALDPAVGFFESEVLRPQTWRPSYLNPNFRRMSPRDGFWGAKIVMKLSDADIRAIVKEAKYSRQESADYIARHLMRRRDKIGAYWYRRVNPLDNLRLIHSQGQPALGFDDLAIRDGIAPRQGVEYRYRWHAYRGDKIGDWEHTGQSEIPLVGDAVSRFKDDDYYILRIQTKRVGAPWSPALDVAFKCSGESLSLIGLFRRY